MVERRQVYVRGARRVQEVSVSLADMEALSV